MILFKFLVYKLKKGVKERKMRQIDAKNMLAPKSCPRFHSQINNKFIKNGLGVAYSFIIDKFLL